MSFLRVVLWAGRVPILCPFLLTPAASVAWVYDCSKMREEKTKKQIAKSTPFYFLLRKIARLTKKRFKKFINTYYLQHNRIFEILIQT